MARRNPLEKALDHVTDDFERRLKSARGTNAVPLGQEELTPREFRARFPNMSEFERRQMLDTQGQAAVVKLLRGGQ